MSNTAIIPSSLKWLLDKRARIAGEIEKASSRHHEKKSELSRHLARARASVTSITKAIDKAQDLHDRVRQSLEASLAAIDLVIQHHEVPIDPCELRTVKEHTNAAIGKRGLVTRLIMQCLREAAGNSRTTTEIACYLASRMEHSPVVHDFALFKYQVRKRLGHLVWEGRLERVHAAQTSAEGRWRLAPSFPSSDTRRPGDGLANNHATT